MPNHCVFVRVDKIDGFIKIYDRTKYLVLFDPDSDNAIYSRISYLVTEKGCITYSIDHNFGRI